MLGSAELPSFLLLGGGGATPLTSQSSSFVTLVPRSRGTSTPVNADVDDPLSPSQKLPDGHLPLPLQPLSHPCYSPTPLTGLIMIFVPCLNSSLEFILVSGFRCDIRTPSLAFLLCGLKNTPFLNTKRTPDSVLLYAVCYFTHNMSFYTQCVILLTVCNFTHIV